MVKPPQSIVVALLYIGLFCCQGEVTFLDVDDENGTSDQGVVEEVSNAITRIVDAEQICGEIEKGCPSNRILVLVDKSKSLGRRKVVQEVLPLVGALACGAVTNMKSKIGLISFGNEATVEIPLKHYSMKKWLAKIENFRRDEGFCCTESSALAEALELAKKEFVPHSEESSMTIIIVSDGYVYPPRSITAISAEEYKMEVVPKAIRSLKSLGARVIFAGVRTRNGKDPDVLYFQGKTLKECNGSKCFHLNPQFSPLVSIPSKRHIFVEISEEALASFLLEELCEMGRQAGRDAVAPAFDPPEKQCGEEPRSLIVALDASTSIDETSFYAGTLNIALEALIQVDPSKGAQTGLIAFGKTLQMLLPLKVRSIMEIRAQVEEIRQFRLVAFGCCSPYAWLFERVREEFRDHGAEGNQPLLLVIGDGRPFQNLVYPEKFISFSPEEMERARFLAEQVPGSSFSLRLETNALVAFVGTPDRGGTLPDMDYFSGKKIGKNDFCSTESLQCFDQTLQLTSSPTKAFAHAIFSFDGPSFEEVKINVHQIVCDAVADALENTVANDLGLETEESFDLDDFDDEGEEEEEEHYDAANTFLGEDLMKKSISLLEKVAVTKEPKEIVFALDTEVAKEIAVLLVHCVRSLPLDSKVGVILFRDRSEEVVHLAHRSPREFTEELQKSLQNCCTGDGFQELVLADALRDARQIFERQKDSSLEKIVIVIASSNPAISPKALSSFFRGEHPAKYLARIVPLEARALRKMGFRVIFIAGPEPKNRVMTINLQYLEGTLSPDFEFCKFSKCFRYQGKVLDSADLISLGEWNSVEAFHGLFRRLSREREH